MKAHRRYVGIVLAVILGFVVPVAALNLQLAANGVRFDKDRLASDWQQARRGVTYAPPISYNRPFKTLRLNARLPQINTIVLGSSTVMGIRQEILPPALAVYNYAQNGNGLVAMIREGEYIAAHWAGRVRYLIVPLDWALGFVFQGGEPPPRDLSASAVRAEVKARAFDALAQLKDALSLPRVVDLAAVLHDVLRATSPWTAFREFFLEAGGPEYRCPDGTLARDFDTLYRGMCVGFRFDGSATFAEHERVDPRNVRSVLLAAVAPASKYSVALGVSKGEPDPGILRRLARLAQRMRANGGELILLMPPLLPGLDRALAESAHTREALARVRSRFDDWARRESVVMLDASAAETFGCAPQEFIDAHHALPECYRKVLDRLFQDHPGLLATGAPGTR